jgi:hypothetical protein
MDNPFTAHPRSVGEGYFEHMGSALRVWAWLVAASGAVLVHAFLPFLFPTTGSRILQRLLAGRERPHKRHKAAEG